MRKIEIGGFGDRTFPYFSGPEVPWTAQSDYGVASAMLGWSIEERRGSETSKASDAERAEARAEWLRRYPTALATLGNKGWALRADREARMGSRA